MAELNVVQFVERPPTRLYEVRTVHDVAYRAEGDVIESGDGWFTLWADESTLALRMPEADIRAVRQVPDGELEAQAEAYESDLGRERRQLVEALERVRKLPQQPEVMNANQPNPGIWLDGYRCGVLAARAATRPRDEETVKP